MCYLLIGFKAYIMTVTLLHELYWEILQQTNHEKNNLTTELKRNLRFINVLLVLNSCNNDNPRIIDIHNVTSCRLVLSYMKNLLRFFFRVSFAISIKCLIYLKWYLTRILLTTRLKCWLQVRLFLLIHSLVW